MNNNDHNAVQWKNDHLRPLDIQYQRNGFSDFVMWLCKMYILYMYVCVLACVLMHMPRPKRQRWEHYCMVLKSIKTCCWLVDRPLRRGILEFLASKVPGIGGRNHADMWSSKSSRGGEKRNAETKNQARCGTFRVIVNDRGE